MKLTYPTFTAALATLAVAAAPAGAQEEKHHLHNMRVSDVSAYYSDVFVTVQGSRRSYAIAELGEDGRHSWLPIPSARHPYVTDVGSDSQGGRHVVYSRADRSGDHDLYAYDLQTKRERKLAGSRRGTDERFPSMYADQIVFFRSGAGKRNGIYHIDPLGPAKGKEKLIWRTSVARSTDIEDDEIVFETDVKVGRRTVNGIYGTREDSTRPRLIAASARGATGNRTLVQSASIQGGYLTYLRYDSNRQPQHTVYRQLLDGLATDSRYTARPADATAVALGGPRLFFVRSGWKGVFEVNGSQWLGA